MTTDSFSGPRRLVYDHDRLALTTVSPDQAVNGATARLQCFGTHYNEGCVIFYDGAPQTTEYFSVSLVAADVPVGDAGPHTVEVRDAYTGRKSDLVDFTVT